MAFFVMSFVDLVGIGVDRVSKDMSLSATVAQLIPSAAFLWFFVLSVPVGVLQSRLGKKNMLNIGMGVTALGLLVPFFFYTFPMVLAGFALLGIGNTIVQVSANPLMVDVVPGNRASSFLSFSQFVKAIGSMIGAPLAAFFAAQFGDWKIMFLVFGIVSILSVLWLGSAKIEETRVEGYKATFSSSFRLLGNGYVLLLVLSIFLVVGVDVGFNSNSGQFLIKRFRYRSDCCRIGTQRLFPWAYARYLRRCNTPDKDFIPEILYVDFSSWNHLSCSHSTGKITCHGMGTCIPYRHGSCKHLAACIFAGC